MSKRILAVFLTALLGLGLLSGCAGQGETAETGKLAVTATLFPYYDFARAIGGERVDVTLLLAPGRESHSFEPTPLDVIKIQKADVFLYNGGAAETWVTEVLEGLDAPGQVRACMMDHVDALEEELAEGMEPERGGHDHAAEETEAHADEDDGHAVEIEYDEHIWTSPVNAKLLSAAVCDALVEADPAGEDYYRENLSDYQARLAELDQAFRDVVAQGKRKLMVFGDRFPLLYFCKTYGLDYRAAFQGCSSDTEPSVKTLAYLIDKVREEHIPVVYRLELSSSAVSEVICESTAAKPLLFHSCHNVSPAEFQAGESYLSLMWNNVDALREGLQ